MKTSRIFASLALVAFFSCSVRAQNAPLAGKSCEALAGVALPQAKVTSAQSVAAGAFNPPPTGASTPAALAAFAKSLPAFCRISVEAAPSADSDIKIEVWLPATNWNGKFQGRGNGGFAGQIDYRPLGIAVAQGYASASTDTGHAGAATDAKWAIGHPEKVVDFAYRAIHVMTQIAKTLSYAFYGVNPRHSYFVGCSTGGRQALMEAQRYPADYDGIIAGAPANYWTHLLSANIWNTQALTQDPASYIPPRKIPTISAAVNDACDNLDGVTDGILNDPRQCHFDPAVLLCKNGDADSCLTGPQITTLKKLYEGAHDSHGRVIFPGFLPGAETGDNGWPTWITGSTPTNGLGYLFTAGFFADMVYENPDWDITHADLDQAVKTADDKLARTMNATDPDLTSFKSHGGKLIIFHGWDDPAIPALNTIDYYSSVIDKMGQQAAGSFVRVFMIPGMQHCGGGPGTDSFNAAGPATPMDPQHNMQLAIEQWVEKGAAPNSIIAAKIAPRDAGTVMTRPLCPYPRSAKYKGSGDTNSAANFACAINNR